MPKREATCEESQVLDEVDNKPKRNNRKLSLEQFFDEQLDVALQIGMTDTQFWYSNPRLMLNYIEKYKAEQLIIQQNAWLIGAYVKNALQSTILVAGLADKNTNQKMPKYPEMPRPSESNLSEEEKTILAKRVEKYFERVVEAQERRKQQFRG